METMAIYPVYCVLWSWESPLISEALDTDSLLTPTPEDVTMGPTLTREKMKPGSSLVHSGPTEVKDPVTIFLLFNHNIKIIILVS